MKIFSLIALLAYMLNADVAALITPSTITVNRILAKTLAFERDSKAWISANQQSLILYPHDLTKSHETRKQLQLQSLMDKRQMQFKIIWQDDSEDTSVKHPFSGDGIIVSFFNAVGPEISHINLGRKNAPILAIRTRKVHKLINAADAQKDNSTSQENLFGHLITEEASHKKEVLASDAFWATGISKEGVLNVKKTALVYQNSLTYDAEKKEYTYLLSLPIKGKKYNLSLNASINIKIKYADESAHFITPWQLILLAKNKPDFTYIKEFSRSYLSANLQNGQILANRLCASCHIELLNSEIASQDAPNILNTLRYTHILNIKDAITNPNKTLSQTIDLFDLNLFNVTNIAQQNTSWYELNDDKIGSIMPTFDNLEEKELYDLLGYLRLFQNK